MTDSSAHDGQGLVGIDPKLVDEWLTEEAIGARLPIRLSRLGDGKSNLTYLAIDGNGDSWVLRRPPLGNLLPSAHDVAREYRILSSLVRTDVPIAHPIALRLPDERMEVPLLLMRFVPGLAIDSEAKLATVPGELRHTIGLSMARSLASIHAVDIRAVGLDDLASHRAYAGRQIRRWWGQFESSKVEERPLIAELARRLEAGLPEQRETTLVHGDYHLLNVIVDLDSGTVNGIVDWELSTLGDPVADLGGLLARWPQAEAPSSADLRPLSAATGFPGRSEMSAAYAEASGRDLSALGYWETLGCWKIAIIQEGVLRRRLDEPRNGDSQEAAARIDLTLERAAWTAERAGL